MRLQVAAVAVGVWAAGCSRPVKTARVSRFEPPMPAELEARDRLARKSCSPRWSLLWPGLGQLCTGKKKEGTALLVLGAAELVTGVTVAGRTAEGIEHPGAALPLLAAQDLWIYSVTAPSIDEALAQRQLYAPQDSLLDMMAAPFNIEVMKRPEVWLGLAGMLAAGIGLSMAIDDPIIDRDRVGADPNIFGRTFDRRAGHPLAFGIGAGLFGHVAIAEEVLFRGSLQSGIARRRGERRGWIEASLIFGAAHAMNLLVIPKEERAQYLMVGLPFITALGGYMGWVYRNGQYSLGPPVALHFWYDLLLSATFYALDPQNSLLSARIAVPL